MEELYNDEQKKDTTISFYSSIINNAIAEGQSIKEVDDNERICKYGKEPKTESHQ